MTAPASFAIAIANGQYTALQPLATAVPEAAALVKLLETKHGFEAVLLDDRRRGALLDEVDRWLGPMSLKGGALVVLWSGHGTIGDDGELRLMGRSDTGDVKIATAADLGEWAARTGAAQVLVIVDTCYSGGGVTSALAMADAVLGGRSNPAAAWFGVVAAARGDELARSGALASEFERLLSEGPRDERLRLRWSAYDARVRGDDVIDALMKEWSEPRHSPQQAATGNPWPMLRNPLHRPHAQHRVVEHLLQAARGTSGDISYFTGREGVLERIVAWLRRAAPGICVVTGPAGSGKSAIVGRVVSLSDPDERARLLQGGPVEARLDPGEGRVSAHLHCRGLDPKATAANLASQLGLDADAAMYDLLALAHRRRIQGAPLVLVLDGLDEAGDGECRDVALEIVQPLAKETLILIGTREVPGGVGEPGLLALLGSAAETIDLGRLVEDTLRDVQRYIVRRLEGVAAEMRPDAVAEELVANARGQDPTTDGPFLLARLVTSQLRLTPVDTSQDGWKNSLATGVVTALENDLDGTVLVVDGHEHPTAARELLRALSAAQGSGFPADDVWPTAATALSASGTTYTREDVYSLLLALGRHIVAGAEGDQGVYRVAHQRLVDHLLPVIGPDPGRRLQHDAALNLARALAALYESLLDHGQPPDQHTYLWRYAWRHFADAGAEGIELLRRFVARDREKFLPDLALALSRVGSSSWLRGSPEDAAALHRESVAIRRELKKPLDLALALFNLSFALGSAGDVTGADEAATEASDIARGLGDDPDGRRLLTTTLTAQGLTQFRRGNLRAAVRLAEEAVALAEPDAAGQKEAAFALSSALCVAANGSNALGDYDKAETYSRRALALLDERQEDSLQFEAILVDVLCGRALIELGGLLRRLAGPPPAAEPPRAESAARIVGIYRRRGRTGTLPDIYMAEGLRLFAITIVMEGLIGLSRPDAPDPVSLLDEAIDVVQPLAAHNLDAIGALTSSRLAKARMLSDTDRDRALETLGDSEREIRPYAKTSPVMQLLGQVLDLQVALTLTPESVGALVEKQREAVTMLRQSNQAPHRLLTVQAFARLIDMLDATGQKADAMAARQQAADVWREMQDGSLAAAIHFAALLSDLAAGILGSRPVEALDFATEASGVLEPFAANPSAALLRGVCELNRGAALLALARNPEARPCFERAVQMLGIDNDVPRAGVWLAAALCNLSGLQVEAGEPQAALESAQRAVQLLERTDDELVASTMPAARISLGRALRACGQNAEGTAMLKSGVTAARERMTSDEAEVVSLAVSLNNAGGELWDEVLASFADQPLVARKLEVLRARPREELAITAALFRDRLAHADPGEIRFLRSAARGARFRDPAGLDAAWQRVAGELPTWLTLDAKLESVLVAWWNTGTWQASRDYLLANPILLDPATDTLIAEMRDAGLDEQLVSKHLQLLAEARARGAEEAYKPVLARVLVGEWYATDLGDEFLADHLDALLGPAVAQVLDEAVDVRLSRERLARAILVLARRGEQATAYRGLRDAAFAMSTLQQALRTPDAERIDALATVCLKHDMPDADSYLAATALAVAMAVRDDLATALELVKAVVDGATEPAQRAPLVQLVTDAMARHPGRVDALVKVLTALSAAPAGPGAGDVEPAG